MSENEITRRTELSESGEEITLHAVEKDGVVTAIWEMAGRKHLRTIDPRSPKGQEILRLYTTEPQESGDEPQESADEPPQETPVSENDQLALALIDAHIRLVSITPDGEYRFVDATQTPHSILYLIASETVALQQAVEEFEFLINDPKVREEDCQAFFERNPDFILNDEYKQAHPHLALANSQGEELVPDFVLEPTDQTALCDLLELKLPSAQTFVLKKNRMRFSAAVLEACAQLRAYNQYFDERNNRKAFEKAYPGLRAFKPKMFVIIGRQGKVDPLARRSMQADLPNLILHTYDQVLARMKWKVDAMKRGKFRR